jgi:transcriptional regulator with XRE-family HTH domain
MQNILEFPLDISSKANIISAIKDKGWGDEVMSIGENLKDIRQRRGMSQGKLADMINVSLHTIFRIENNKTQPRAADVKKLAEALGVPELALLNDPAEEGYRVILKYTKTLEGVSDEMMITGMELTVSDDGYVRQSRHQS